MSLTSNAPHAQGQGGRRFGSGLSNRLWIDPNDLDSSPPRIADTSMRPPEDPPRESPRKRTVTTEVSEEEDAKPTQQWPLQQIEKSAGSTSSSRSLERVNLERIPEHTNGVNDFGANGLADFFSPEVFRIVLHNPTTAFQLRKFSQSRMCGENMEFLEKIDRYNTLLDSMNKVMSEIYRSFTAPDAKRPLNISSLMTKQINKDIKSCTTSTLPGMELIFAEVQEYVEEILATDVYPRFVKYQMTTSATKALSSDRGKYQGLGDCFCLTDPTKGDNPIMFASDGFLKVTGYSRKEVIPRNCRFLQGTYTDRDATQRLKASIAASEETVELLLNYRKTGEPFWNLLYVAPLYDGDGSLAFFLGGQINCSTTIRDCSDILRVLSMSDEVDDEEDRNNSTAAPSMHSKPNNRMNFFKSFRREPANKPASKIKSSDRSGSKVGMEQGLINRIERMDFRTQMEMFYTAYSKYLVVSYETMTIQFYSPSIVDLLTLTTETSATLVGSDIFKFLGRHTATPSRDFKNRVKESLRIGMAISAEVSLSTLRSLTRRREDRFVTHWTPLKDERGMVTYVILTLSLTGHG